MERFGHDAPDLRFGLEIVDVTDLAREAEFRVFRAAADSGQRVRGINAKGAAAKYSRKDIDELTASICQVSAAKGLAWFKVEEGGTLASPIAKNFAPSLLAKIAERMQAAPGDFLLFVADAYDVTCKALHNLRKRLGEELKLYEPNAMHFSWIVEFPMFAWDEEEKTWAAMHHPFTAPRPQDTALLKSEPGKCRARPTTWSSTVPKLAAAPSEFTINNSSRMCSNCSASTAKKPASVSAFYSTRSSSAPPRTAASLWELIVGLCCWAA